MSTNDDEYGGCYIPKGTIVFGSTMASLNDFWALFVSWLSLFRSILNDPKVFNNPLKYQPERYLKDGKLNPDVMVLDSVVFGYGRRWVHPIYLYKFRYISHGAFSHFFPLAKFVLEDN